MISSGDLAQLSECCFNAYEALKTTTQGKNMNDLDESVRGALEGLERCVYWS
jgi:hypothetical protein